jgi:hypothetical protein
MLAVAVALPPCGTLAVVGFVEIEKLCAVLLNVAVTVEAVLIVKLQVVFVSLQTAPDQPAKALPADGVAVRVTFVPGAKDAVHALPQLIPAGLDVTVPVPEPMRRMVTCGRDKMSCSTFTPKRPSAPIALIRTGYWPGVASAVAVSVAILESVAPLRPGGLNVNATPLGSPESLSVSAPV